MSWINRKKSGALGGHGLSQPAIRPGLLQWRYYPNELNAYLLEEQDAILAARRQVEEFLAAEDAALATLNLPVPMRTADYTLRPECISSDNPNLDYVEILLPTFDIPPHQNFSVFRYKGDLGPLYMKEWYQPTLTYCVTAAPKTLERIVELFKREGLPAVMECAPGGWFNRDPYGVYKALNAVRTMDFPRGVRVTKSDGLKAHDTPQEWAVIPVAPIADFGEVEFRRFEQGLELFTSVITLVRGYTDGVPIKSNLYIRAPVEELHVSRDIVFSLPYPRLPDEADLVTLKVLPSPEAKPALARQFFEALRSVEHPITFEIIKSGGSIHFELEVSALDLNFVEHQLKIHFPDFAVTACEPPLPTDPLYTFTATVPVPFESLKTMKDFAIDPYRQLFGLLEQEATDYASVRITCSPRTEGVYKLFMAWAEAQYQSYSWREMLKQGGIEKKLDGWFTGLRATASDTGTLDKMRAYFLDQFETHERRWHISRVTKTAAAVRDVPLWSIMSASELAALAHFPGRDAQTESLETTSTKAKLPPEAFTAGEVILGESEARGQTKPVTLPEEVRDRHLYLVGKSGVGKSTLMLNAARQDIERGAGVAVIDPHGDLVRDLLDYVPQRRIKDVIYFDAADKAHPIGLNIMNARTDEEVELLADDLLVTFRRLSESWGERMETILRYAFHTLLRAEGTTFLDVQTLLQDPSFRMRVVDAVNFAPLADFWHHQYPAMPKDAAQPILSRMSKFALSSTLSGILSQPSSTLNFYDVLQGRKILLVNLGGSIGEDTTKLLGSLIVSQFQLAVMRRAALPRERRLPYYLYVDEFQNFTTSAFDKILSEARKYKLSLALAHQYVSQLDERTRNAILGNVGTIVMFQLGIHDANYMRAELGRFEPQDLTDLSGQRHEALMKPATQSSDTFKFVTFAPPAPTRSHASAIIEHTRKTYSTPKVSRPTAPPALPERAQPPVAPERVIESVTEKAVVDAPPHEQMPLPPAATQQTMPREESLRGIVQKTTPVSPPPPEQPPSAAPPVQADASADESVPQPAAQTGRGGRQHKYLQQLIKRLAEDKGYRVVVEQPVLGGTGFVDVSLERGEQRIACEISVTSTDGYELNNIQKCLAAGYEPAVIISSDRKALGKIRRLAEEQLEAEVFGKLMFLSPEEFVTYLGQAEAETMNKEETVRGYKVKVQYRAVDDAEKRARKQAISQVILRALKRMRGTKE